MHGTVVMLMALSGLGCHYKHADVAYVPSCFSSISDGCYSSCYSSTEPAYLSGCYSSADYIGGCYSESCYSSCYSDPWPSCYSGGGHGCFLKRLFGHGGGGLFKKHHRAYSSCYSSSCYSSSCYSGCYSSVYDPPVFGSSMPIYETPWASSQTTGGPAKSMYTAPGSEAPATPAPAAPAPKPAPANDSMTPAATPPPPPTPTPASAVEDVSKEVAPAPAPAPNVQP